MEITKDLLKKVSSKCSIVCQSRDSLHHSIPQTGSSQVKNFFTQLFETKDWPARWHCGNWTDFHGWLYILSDLAIWASYFAIPLLLFNIIRNRKDIPFPRILWLFIAFILLCGLTHLLDALIFWWPAYRLSAMIRFLTGIVSLFTVFALYKLLPRIYRLRTLSQLEAEITERKKAEEEVQHQQLLMKANEDLMAKKDEFVSIASHELKTPLTIIKSYTQLLLEKAKKNEDPFEIDTLTRVETQANKMSSLIQNILDNGRLSEGKFAILQESFDLKELLNEILEDSKTIYLSHKIVLKDMGQTYVFADRVKIGQVLENLISNAVKFSPKQSTITIGGILKGGFVELSVSDQGVGINPEDQEKLFERFYRIQNEKTKTVAGFGIGLYLVSEILRYHNTRIMIESKPDQGSTFYFQLPISKEFS